MREPLLPWVRFLPFALPALARAALRVALLERRLPLDAAVDRLRAVPPFRRRLLRDPRRHDVLVGLAVRVLPPWRAGPCYKRSLLLLDLWARCGLAPRFHLGVATDAGAAHGHAWVTLDAHPGESRYPVVWSR